MKINFIIFLLFTCSTVKAQTCIIIYAGKNGITAGADRLYQETVTSNTSVKQKKYYARKIFAGKNVYWAFSGADYHDSLHTICRTACSGNLPLRGIIKTVERAINRPGMKQAMKAMLQSASADQKKRMKANMTEIAFFRYENTLYKSYRMTVFMPGADRGEAGLRVETDSIKGTPNSYGLFVLGHYDAFDKMNKSADWSKPVQAIAAIIRQQSIITPNEVSASLDMLRLTSKGVSWVSSPQ